MTECEIHLEINQQDITLPGDLAITQAIPRIVKIQQLKYFSVFVDYNRWR